MKPAEQRHVDARRQHIEAIVGHHMRKLFERLPMVAGFCLQADLRIAELSFTWPGYKAGWDLYHELTQSLAHLVDERPEAVPLMRERTFARAVH